MIDFRGNECIDDVGTNSHARIQRFIENLKASCKEVTEMV